MQDLEGQGQRLAWTPCRQSAQVVGCWSGLRAAAAVIAAAKPTSGAGSAVRPGLQREQEEDTPGRACGRCIGCGQPPGWGGVCAL